MKNFLIIAAVILFSWRPPAHAQQRDSRRARRRSPSAAKRRSPPNRIKRRSTSASSPKPAPRPKRRKKMPNDLTRVLAEVKKLLGKERRGQNQRLFIDAQLSLSARRQTRDRRLQRQQHGAHQDDQSGSSRPPDRRAMQAGANNVNRLMFTLKDEQAAQLDALRTASAKAKVKAEAIAASLGLQDCENRCGHRRRANGSAGFSPSDGRAR